MPVCEMSEDIFMLILGWKMSDVDVPPREEEEDEECVETKENDSGEQGNNQDQDVSGKYAWQGTIF